MSLSKEVNRLATFNEKWMNIPGKPHSQTLAKTGFYYIGAQTVPDSVKCYFCDVVIGFWEVDDDVVDEHLRFSPHCKLLTDCQTDNIPLEPVSALKRLLRPKRYNFCNGFIPGV